MNMDIVNITNIIKILANDIISKNDHFDDCSYFFKPGGVDGVRSKIIKLFIQVYFIYTYISNIYIKNMIYMMILYIYISK